MSKCKGYKGIGPEAGNFVSAEDAFDYAAEECGIKVVDLLAPLSDEFHKMLVEWYFSGNWVDVSENER